MKYVGIAVWVSFAVYCFSCIWFPEIRFIYWKGTSAKIGTLSYLGATLFLWSPLLAILQLLPKGSVTLLYGIMLIAFIITVIGSLVDVKKL